MTEIDQEQNPYTARFKQLLGRSAIVARQRIEAEGQDAPISTEARERARNVLRYVLEEEGAWTATRDLLLAMAPKMERAGYRGEWLQDLMAGLAQSQRRGDRRTEAELQFQCGYLYRLMSDYAHARIPCSVPVLNTMRHCEKPSAKHGRSTN